MRYRLSGQLQGGLFRCLSPYCANLYTTRIEHLKDISCHQRQKKTQGSSLNRHICLGSSQEDVTLFPELRNSSSARVLIAIDPDINGAISIFKWQGSIESGDTPTPSQLLAQASVTVFDMPTEIWPMRSRNKRRLSADGLIDILSRYVQKEVDFDSHACVRATVEFSTPTHLSGKFAWYDSGFASGILAGIFRAMEIPFERVPATVWKKELGLTKLGKPGSLALARYLFDGYQEEYLKYVCVNQRINYRKRRIEFLDLLNFVNIIMPFFELIEFTNGCIQEEERPWKSRSSAHWSMDPWNQAASIE